MASRRLVQMMSPGLLGLIAAFNMTACGGSNFPANGSGTSAETDAAAAGSTGQLIFLANGEDFVRQGFTTTDGWDIRFDHVYVTLAEMTAYQSDPPFDPQVDMEFNAKELVRLDEAITIDLAEGDEEAEPITVAEISAPVGRYNALTWNMVSAQEGPSAGYSLMLQGEAAKDSQTLNFTVKLAEELAFSCGDFIGEERKGILTSDDQAHMEATFHFDHLFGDGEAPPDSEINLGALGFDPLADLAQDGQLDIDSSELKAQLPNAGYQRLMEILPSLGHVGEGHCNETKLTQ